MKGLKKRKFLTAIMSIIMTALLVFHGSAVQALAASGGGGLNLANQAKEYTGVDGGTVSSAAQGKPKVLVFYSNLCGNSKQTIRNISQRISDFSKADVCAVEINKGTKDAVRAFQTSYGCQKIAFAYDERGVYNQRSMWDYLNAGGYGAGSVTLPVVVYIDAANRFQHVTTATQTAAAVLANLTKYGGGQSQSKPDPDPEPQPQPQPQPPKPSSLPRVEVKPGAGNVVIGLSGAYYTETAEKLLKRLNEIRLEACKQGVKNPETGAALREADYVPLRWSSDLEAIARLRAAEATVNQAHTRTNGERCFTAVTDRGEQSWAENLAWNYSGMLQGIEQWYGEKEDWVQQRADKVTGHYTSIISPRHTFVGMGAFRLSSGGWHAVAQEFGLGSAMDGQKDASQGSCLQLLEMKGDKVSALAFDKKALSLQEGGSAQLALQVTVQYNDYYGTAKSHKGPYQAGGNWRSSDEAVLTVDGTGKVQAKAKGTAAVTFSVGSASASLPVTVGGVGEAPDESEGQGSFSLPELPDFSYAGTAIKPTVEVYDGETLLREGKEYQLSYHNNVNANPGGLRKQGSGTGEEFLSSLPYVEVVGMGNYSDAVKINFNILPRSIGDGQAAEGVTLRCSEELAVSGSAERPFLSLSAGKELKLGSDFSLALTAVNARDAAGKNLPAGELLLNDSAGNPLIPAGYAGEFLLTVKGLNNYEGSIARSIRVAEGRQPITDAKITLGSRQKTVLFSSVPVQLTPSVRNSADTFTVSLSGKILTPGQDYTVRYRNNDRVGKAELIVTGTGGYAGEKTAMFTVKGLPFSAGKVTVAGVTPQVYTGQPLTQSQLALSYAGKGSLRFGTDYTVSYKKNVGKGVAVMTFKGREEAGFSGSFTKTFQIIAADISTAKRAAGMEQISVPYRKDGAAPAEEISLTNQAGVPLQNGKDYTVSYKNNRNIRNKTDAKPPTIVVSGKGSYKGKVEIPFTITKAKLEDGAVKLKASALPYQEDKAAGYAYRPKLRLMEGKSALQAGKDYEIRYENNTQAGCAAYFEALANAPSMAAALQPRVVIRALPGSGYEQDAEWVVPLPVYRGKLSRANLLVEVAPARYTGKQIKPEVKVTYLGASGAVTLAQDTDYSLSYGANIRSGKTAGSVTISGIGPKYGGSVTVRFEIQRRQMRR